MICHGRASLATRVNGDDFVGEVKKVGGKKQHLTAGTLAALREEHARTIARTIAPARRHASKAGQFWQQLSELVNEA